jgi:predicted dehydrogenase
MQLAAERAGVVTQMGNQIQSHPGYRTAVRLVHDGVIGKVREVHSWQSGGMRWMLVDDRPPGSAPIPETVHWDEWLGVAPERPYLPNIYHSFNWRAWQDFSNGQLGDFGCHILDPVFMALKLGSPLSIRAEAPSINQEVWTKSATVSYEFPGTELTAGKSIHVTWYDGEGHFPPREKLGLPEAYRHRAGSVLVGEKGTMIIPHVGMPQLFPEEKYASFVMPELPERDHYTSWVDACRGEDQTTSHFAYSGPLSEAVLLGTVAIRNRGTTLAWNSAQLELSGSPRAQAMLSKPYRKGWEPKWI